MLQIISIDIAKDVFEVGVFNQAGRCILRKRLSRDAFRLFLATAEKSLVVAEACGTSHYWAREAKSFGHEVRLLPPAHVKPFRRGNKTDRTDVNAIHDASRSHGIRSVPVKSVEQQNLQLVHRAREQRKAQRVRCINGLRAILREHGVVLPLGADAFMAGIRDAIEKTATVQFLRPILDGMLEELAACDVQLERIEQMLKVVESSNPAVPLLETVPGIGLITSTAFVSAIADPNSFDSGRQVSNWIGITPREYSSGNTRMLGGITHRGDVYLRMLLIHGARAFLAGAIRVNARDRSQLTPLQLWAVDLRSRMHFNKAAVAVANKLARLCLAVWKRGTAYEANYSPREVSAA